MAKKSPMDLLNEDDSKNGLPDRNKKPEAPITTVLRNFMSKHGEELELTTRMNGPAVKAAQVSYIFETMFTDPVTGQKESPFIHGMMEQIERLLVSFEGLGRKDQIDALSAGGKLPDAYYQDGTGKRNFLEVRE